MQGVSVRPSNLRDRRVLARPPLACKTAACLQDRCITSISSHILPMLCSRSPLAGAIVSYTGSVGTEYTSDANVDFWQLRHGGDNQSIIRDAEKVSCL